jgi:hypothetical protein
MKPKIIFGLLLLKTGIKVSQLAERILLSAGMRKLEPDEKQQSYTLIWDVVEGPYPREDFDEEDLFKEGVPIGLDYMVVARIEEDGEVSLVNFWYETEEEALQVVHHFKSNIEPLEVN